MNTKKKILIVEDDEFTIKLYTRLLTDAGYQIVNTTNASEALDMAKREKPNLIIMDLMLMDGNGFEVIKQIRNEKNLNNVPIITLSNLGQETDINEAIKKGSNKYFVKSNTRFEEVVEAIKNLI